MKLSNVKRKAIARKIHGHLMKARDDIRGNTIDAKVMASHADYIIAQIEIPIYESIIKAIEETE